MQRSALSLVALVATLLLALAWWWPQREAPGALGPGRGAEAGPAAPVGGGLLPEASAARASTERGAAPAAEAPGAPSPRPREPSPSRADFPETPAEEDEALELPIAGDVSGRLVSERGAWSPADLPDRDTLIVELVRLEEPRLERRAELVIEEDEEGGLQLSFLFAAVPEGEYQLSLFHLGTWHWEPRSRLVRPPAAGLDFVRYDRDELVPLVFEVVDAQTGEAIEDYSVRHLEQTVSAESGVFMHAGPLDVNAFPRASSFRWSLWAEGYRPRFGDERDFGESDGRRQVRVELERGWAARLVVLGRAPSLKPLPGAGVRIDGHFAGGTDHDGGLVVEWPRRPERIEVEYEDWVLENDPFDPRPGTTAELRGHVAPLILEPPE